MIRMAEMIGPRQGVQPKANAKPTTKRSQRRLAALHRMQALVGIQGLDLDNAGQMQAKNDDHRASHPFKVLLIFPGPVWPMPVAAAPSITNTRVKPRINMSECNSTVFNSLRSLFCSSSTLAPEINETYPGTSGSTHGDKNETIPARNAVIGKGNEDIGLSKQQEEGCPSL